MKHPRQPKRFTAAQRREVAALEAENDWIKEVSVYLAKNAGHDHVDSWLMYIGHANAWMTVNIKEVSKRDDVSTVEAYKIMHAYVMNGLRNADAS